MFLRALVNLGMGGVPEFSKPGSDTAASSLAILRYGIGKLAAEGRLVLLIDGLDHVDGTPVAIHRLQDPATIWTNSHVVVSGRYQAFAPLA